MAGAVHALACICGSFPLVITTRQRHAAASSSCSSVGVGCELAEACGMQLVLWRRACVGRWWSGVGSDGEGQASSGGMDDIRRVEGGACGLGAGHGNEQSAIKTASEDLTSGNL
eukprot:1136153-Pelagomonas_calceolata.AAC.2